MKNNLSIAAIPAPMVDLVWDQVDPLIRSVQAKAPDDISPAVVKEELVSGRKTLVVINRKERIIAVNVLDIKVLDSGVKVLYIPITAGTEMKDWMEDFLNIATAIAKDCGCIELRGLAVRKGWMKKLEPYGWEEMFTTIRYRIGE